MARGARNYAAEYAARKALEERRAAAEGRAPDISRARGHGSGPDARLLENRRRRALNLASRLGGSEMREAAKLALKRRGLDWLETRLKDNTADRAEFSGRVDSGQKYSVAAIVSSGQNAYFTFKNGDDYDPDLIALFYYHP